jgi:ATP-dependent Clp protease protease subunit
MAPSSLPAPSSPSETEAAFETPKVVTDALFQSRTITVFGEITDRLARNTVAQLLALDAAGTAAIRMFVSSPGGHVESGDAIHDTIRFISAPVVMIGSGWVASAGALIYLAAKKEYRYCLRNTRFLLHQPIGGASGSSSDLEIHAREILKMRRRLNLIISRETGQSLERVERDTDRDYWLSADEAQTYGIVTHIVDRADEIRMPSTG